MILNGRVDFQKEMSAYQQLVRECETFTGPLDPLKGDAVYVAIQGTAKETMSNLFNETLRNRTDAQRPVDSFAGASVSSQAAGPRYCSRAACGTYSARSSARSASDHEKKDTFGCPFCMLVY